MAGQTFAGRSSLCTSPLRVPHRLRSRCRVTGRGRFHGTRPSETTVESTGRPRSPNDTIAPRPYQYGRLIIFDVQPDLGCARRAAGRIVRGGALSTSRELNRAISTCRTRNTMRPWLASRRSTWSARRLPVRSSGHHLATSSARRRRRSHTLIGRRRARFSWPSSRAIAGTGASRSTYRPRPGREAPECRRHRPRRSPPSELRRSRLPERSTAGGLTALVRRGGEGPWCTHLGEHKLSIACHRRRTAGTPQAARLPAPSISRRRG